MLALLAQHVVVQERGPAWGYSWGELLVGIVIFAAVIAVVYVALNYFEVAPPPWAVKIFWIVIVAAVAIFAIRLLLSM